jgi:hypothetical protein
MNQGYLVNDSGVTRNNPYFEYYRPEGYKVQLTPSNDINQVIRESDGVVIAVFSKDDSYNLHKFLRTL